MGESARGRRGRGNLNSGGNIQWKAGENMFVNGVEMKYD